MYIAKHSDHCCRWLRQTTSRACSRARRQPVLRVAPPEPPNDKVRYIALTKGKHAIVDAEEWPPERIRAVYEAAQAKRLSDKEQVTSDKQDNPLKATAERIAKKIMETPPDRKAKKTTVKGEKSTQKRKKPERHDL